MNPYLTVAELLVYLDHVQRAYGGDIPVYLVILAPDGMALLEPLTEAGTEHSAEGCVMLRLSGPHTAPDPDVLAQARAQDVAETGALQCTGCGCTEHVGCREGCWWVTLEPPLCSTCAAALDDDALQQRLLR
jgi:hypothetical protein